jgi:hypothetical protein
MDGPAGERDEAASVSSSLLSTLFSLGVVLVSDRRVAVGAA